MSSRPPPPERVPGWNLEFSNRMQRWYYFDPVAKKSVWEKPEPLIDVDGGATASVAPVSATGLSDAATRVRHPTELTSVSSTTDDVPDAWTVENLVSFVQKKIKHLSDNDDLQSFVVPVPPLLDTTLRGIICDEAEDAGLVAFQYGRGDDRTVVVHKEGYVTAEQKQMEDEEKELQRQALEDQKRTLERIQQEKARQLSKEELRRIAAENAAKLKEAAIEVKPKFAVRDKRTVDEVQADLLAKKRKEAKYDSED